MDGPSILRSPLIHFLVLGALVFALAGRLGSPRRDAGPTPARVSLDAERVDELRGDFNRQLGRPPDGPELARLIAQAIDEELLYREALARGLDEHDGGIETRLVQKMMFLDHGASNEDPARLLEQARALGLERDDLVVRRILVEKLRLLAATLAPTEIPTEEELVRAFEAQRESLRQPERRSLVHVFLSRDRRGERAQSEAERLRRRIEREQIEPAAAIRLGDAFPLGHALDRRSPADLERSFGSDFAASVFALEPEHWSLPIASAYGLHLVWLEQSFPGELPDFEEVRLRLRRELEQQARDRKLEALLAELRTRYEVAVAEPGEERE